MNISKSVLELNLTDRYITSSISEAEYRFSGAHFQEKYKIFQGMTILLLHLDCLTFISLKFELLYILTAIFKSMMNMKFLLNYLFLDNSFRRDSYIIQTIQSHCHSTTTKIQIPK